MKSFNYIISLSTILILNSCGNNNVESNKPVSENESQQLIEVTQSQFDLGKMELGTFSYQSFNSKIVTNGMIDVPPENKATVSAYFGGYVKNINLLNGQKINKGEILFTLENPEYIKIQQDFLETKSQLNYLENDYERQKELSNENVSSQKTFLKAESDYKVSLAKYESLKKTLILMNIDPTQVSENNLRTTISVTSPISGYVTSVLATKGMFLNPSDVAVNIINTDHMHVELNIFEQDLSRVSVGQEVSITLQNSDQSYPAYIHLINKAIDPQTRSIKVNCLFKNEKDAISLTPGMFVEGEIVAKSNSSISIPAEAIVNIDDKYYILTLKESNVKSYQFEKREIKIGQSNNGFVEIVDLNEIDEKSQVLIKGAYNLIKE